MGCAQSTKQSRKMKKTPSKALDCSIEVQQQRYNPDFMKNNIQSSELNDFSLCALEKKGNYNDIEQCDEFQNDSFDDENTTSSKSEQQQECPNQVIPAQMQINWQLQKDICESSLLQRRIVCNKLKIQSICEISLQQQI